MTTPDGNPQAARGRTPEAPHERDPDRRSARRKARKRALDILFEADLRGTEALATARDRLAQSDPPVPEYAVTLVEGVTARRARIDELLATYAEGWTLDRMPPVDRNLPAHRVLRTTLARRRRRTRSPSTKPWRSPRNSPPTSHHASSTASSADSNS